MEPERARELSERDQLWASLRALKPVIDRLAAGHFDPDGPERQMVPLLAQIVSAELGFRERDAERGV